MAGCGITHARSLTSPAPTSTDSGFPWRSRTYRATLSTLDASQPVTDDNAEWFVPVRWLLAVPTSQLDWEKGMIANRNSACKLDQEFTLDRLGHHFDLDQLGADH